MQKNLFVLIPITMVLGFFFGVNADAKFLTVAILPLTFLMVYPMMVNLQIKKILEGGDAKVQFFTQIMNFLAVPFAAYAFGRIFFPDNHYMALGLLLVGLLPTSGMTISWTGMAKGNIAAAVKMTVFGLILGSFLAPLYIKALMGAEIEIRIGKIFLQIITIVVIPLILGSVTRMLLINKYGMAHYQEKLKKSFPPFSNLGVLGIVFVAMALKAKGIVNNPSILIKILIPLALFYILNVLASVIIGKVFFKRNDAIALLYGTVMRNLSIALAIAVTAFGKEGADIAIVIALGYIIQVQLAAWVVKLTDKIYGPAMEREASQIMHQGLFSLHENDTLKQAIMLLNEEGIHSLAVMNDEKKPVGMLFMDNIIDLIADDVPLDTPLSEIKLEEVAFAELHQLVSKIAKTMKRQHKYKVIVTDNAGKINGVISGEDLLRNLQ
jgi:ACR3 family arsenite efflux pump ArsB/CBS domain-containing protein